MKENISVSKIFLEFFILGLYSFGGPTAHIGFFLNNFVKRKKWLSEKEFMELVSLSQFLPGPSSSQVGFLIGVQKGGYLGGLAAWIGFTIPSAFLMIISALVLVNYNNIKGTIETEKVLNGFASVAIPIIGIALITMGKNFCFDIKRFFIFTISFLILWIWEFPFDQIIIILIGFILGITLNLKKQKMNYDHSNFKKIVFLSKKIDYLLVIFVIVSLTLIILFPLINFYSEFLYLQIFSGLYKSGTLVFGGAHVVLPYLEKEFVVNNLISKELFNGGYGLAQGLPGPLFSFASYIGTAIGIKTNIFQALLLGLGCLFFIFFPGLMLAAITINYWDRLTKLNWFYNGIYGVNASVVGLLFLTFSNILFSNYWDNINGIILVILSTLFIIFLKFPSWLTVIIMGPLSYFVYNI